MNKTLPITKDTIKNIEYSIDSLDASIETIVKMLDSEIPINKASINQIMEIQDPKDLVIIHNKLKEISTRESIKQKPLSDKPDNGFQYKNDQINKKTETDAIDLNASENQSNINKIEVSEFLKNMDFEDLKTLKESISNIFKEHFFVKTSDLHSKIDNQIEKINRIYKNTYELIDTVEKLEEKSPNQEKLEVYNETKSNIEFLNTANKYDTMIQIPIMIQNQNKHDELYIFNRRKKDYKDSSMLISLETINLGTVETYIKKNDNQISCQFKLDNENVENLVKGKINLLHESLKLKGYNLVSVKYIPKKDLFSHKLLEPTKPNISKRYKFDIKV